MLRRFFLRHLLLQPQKSARGSMLLFVMVFGALAFSVIVVGIAGYAVLEHNATNYRVNSEEAFQIAEAGISYYRWHLAHNQTDYQDGTGQAGPYVHSYVDKDGNAIGYFSLAITPPLEGSTVVTIESTGWLTAQPNSKRTIKVRLGFPALTDYAFLTNSEVWIGNGEAIHGKLHANGGIRFDGTADAPITSAVASYLCQSVSGCNNKTEPGIWGQGGPQSFWSFPVPAQDFSAVTAELADIKTKAQSNGLYFSSSGKQGWSLTFASDGTVTAAKVLTTDCSYKAQDVDSSKWIYPCIDIVTTDGSTTYPLPANGLIYVDDTVWVRGVVNGRVTVGTATGKSIIVDNNLTYAAKDGTSVIGLVAEQNILIPHNSPDTMEIDAALLAQNGAAKRYYYSGDIKDNLTIYGSVISNGVWTWSWVTQGGAIVSGYKNTNTTYDANLTYGPPADFPVGSSYDLISWEEVK